LQIKILWELYLEKNHSIWDKFCEILNILRFHIVDFGIGFHATNRSKITKRTLNISLGHIELFREALGTGAEYIIIFEDDSYFSNNSNQSIQVLNLLKFIQSDLDEKIYVNLSASFSLESLGVKHLFSKVFVQEYYNRSSLIKISRKPVTNTLSAVLYNRSFLIHLVEFLNQMTKTNLFKFVPIDWLVNYYFIRYNNTNNSIKCLHVVPGIFPQLSLTSNAKNIIDC